MKNYSVLCVIPARLTSTRLPDKMLADLNGTPMIVQTARAAQKSGAFDEIIVATDSEKIIKVVEEHGFKAMMTDPALPSGTCRVAEIAKQEIADVYVNVQGDEPLVDGEGLKTICECFADETIEMATLSFPLMCEDENNTNAVKLVKDVNNDAIYFSRSLIPHPRNPGIFAPLKHIGVYGYRRDTLLNLVSLKPCEIEQAESLEQLRALYYGIKIRVLDAAKDSIGVDTFADLERVRKILAQQ
ncbi:MAG: 3-deoxy-manno-octulosonate cytidylyltransferase [Candidatus Riflebacteria bacterium]|nr:3-deoxy-manno-octulosonate cytidylyltransferase [Candidatus Riflebacteria bacterium]